ncbi:MAG TPA: DUF4430 domain-containing protein [Solirubrobacteraceae bacterium]|nr:DUF4430 domain-containing protein [Solirubrobacteraceae bacterium]
MSAISRLVARRRARSALAALAVTSLTLAGCGLGAGKAPSGVQLLVTQDFGLGFLHRSGALTVRGQETVMSLLMRNYRVSTRFGGGFVQSIEGLSGGQEAGDPVDWFYYVNGVEAGKGAASTNVHPGDHIWWDRHDWSQTQHIPAIVGSYPEPFLNGVGGKRIPVRVECASVSGHACGTVRRELRAAGVPASAAGLGSGGEPETLRVMVGPWTAIEGDPAAHSIGEGPRASGVYARFSTDGRTLTILERYGRPVRTLHAESGLIAATRRAEEAPVWVVTGTDAAGVDLAARSFNVEGLVSRFAVGVNSSAGSFAVPNEELSRR